MIRLKRLFYTVWVSALTLTCWSAGVCLVPFRLHAQTTTPVTISSQQLPPQLRGFLTKLGNRLTVPGQERAVMVGSLTRYVAGAAQTSSVRVTTQLWGKARIDNLTAGTSIGTNGAQLWASSGALSPDDAGLLETILNDDMGHFLYSIASGSGGRFLGARFRFDDGSTPNYIGPYYDVYTLSDSVLTQNSPIDRWRVYCINSDLGLLDRVQYGPSVSGAAASGQTTLTGWQVFQGQKFPTQIQRLASSGATVFSFTFSSISVGPSMADGLFQP